MVMEKTSNTGQQYWTLYTAVHCWLNTPQLTAGMYIMIGEESATGDEVVCPFTFTNRDIILYALGGM